MCGGKVEVVEPVLEKEVAGEYTTFKVGEASPQQFLKSWGCLILLWFCIVLRGFHTNSCVGRRLDKMEGEQASRMIKSKLKYAAY